MRRIRYSVAASLDGYIAGPHGEFDWIVIDPEIDFATIARDFDTMLLGRKTYEGMRGRQEGPRYMGMRPVVFSNTLDPDEHPDVTIFGSDWRAQLEALRQQPGRDLWLFGGGELFHSLLREGFVDGVEVTLIPVILGEGIPLCPADAGRMTLSLRSHRVYSRTGTVSLEYQVIKT